ncbi:MAG: BON domain-containing protein [Verrucomicrobiota bacterium]|jgi:osmotically-inducible protein OsmY
MKSNLKKSDVELKTDVLAELKYEPGVAVTDIGVLVKDGAVTLNGYVTSYGEKWDAVRATKRVAGVNAIADDIQVKLRDSLRRTDGEIAAAAVKQINLVSTAIPPEDIGVTVREGRITLDGEVEWWYQKNSAESAVQFLGGVTGVTNLITIKPKLSPADIELDIQSAFKRNALFDARKIQVETLGDKVTLRGNVQNHGEREEAERVAWAARGVCSVDNQIKVAGLSYSLQ